MKRIVLLFVLCIVVNSSFGQAGVAKKALTRSLQWGLAGRRVLQSQPKVTHSTYRSQSRYVKTQQVKTEGAVSQPTVSVSPPRATFDFDGKKQVKQQRTHHQINRKDMKESMFYRSADLVFSWMVSKNRMQIDSVLILIKDIKVDSVVATFSKKKGKDNTMVDWNGPSYSFPAVMRAATYLIVLENGGSPDSIVDTREGVYIDNKGDTIRDHNYERGGYGEMSLQRGLMVNSDIAEVQSVERFLPEGYSTLDASLNKMGLRHQGLVSNYQTMCQAMMSPVEMLTWMTSVAKGNVPGISSENVKELQHTLLLHLDESLGKKAQSSKAKSCGISYATLTNNPNNYFLSFIGYFPYEQPLYSVYIEMYKDGKPATSSFAADVYRKISESLMYVINKSTEQ